MDRRFSSLKRLLAEGKVVPWRDGMADVHVTPTVFFWDIPDDLLEERRRRLEAGQGVREWYLVTEWRFSPSELGEELRGDFGILLVEDDSLVVDFERASGESVCDRCGEEYWRHGFDQHVRGYDGSPFLRMLCDGRRVKL